MDRDQARIQPHGQETTVRGRIRARDRLVARWRALKLDRAIADGAAPTTDAALALRAQALVGRRTRRDLSHTLERILRQSAVPASLGPRMVARRDRVYDAKDDLALLARRLGSATQVDARGVARVRVLLSDASGPLYWRRNKEDLRTRVRDAIEALEPGSSRDRREGRWHESTDARLFGESVDG